MLLDPLEKQLYLPAPTVQITNLLRIHLQIVRQNPDGLSIDRFVSVSERKTQHTFAYLNQVI